MLIAFSSGLNIDFIFLLTSSVIFCCLFRKSALSNFSNEFIVFDIEFPTTANGFFNPDNDCLTPEKFNLLIELPKLFITPKLLNPLINPFKPFDALLELIPIIDKGDGIILSALPNPYVNDVTGLNTFNNEPNPYIAGPTAADIETIRIIALCCGLSISINLSVNSFIESIPFLTSGEISSPIILAIWAKLFPNNLILLFIESYAIDDSLCRAVFSSQALFDNSNDFCSISPDETNDWRARESFTRLNPTSDNTFTTDLPSAFTLLSPSIKSTNAFVGSLFQTLTKSSWEYPDTSDNTFNSSLSVATYFSIPWIIRDIEEPAASGSIPNDESAAESPNIWDSVIPTILPAPAKRWAVVTISDSVEARLLPNSTIVDPSLSKLSCDIWVTLANFANSEAPCDLDKFVDTSNAAIVFVKSFIFLLWIPNWPAASPISNKAVTDNGIFLDISSKSLPISFNAWPSKSVVLLNPLNASSYPANILYDAVKPPINGTVVILVTDAPYVFIIVDIDDIEFLDIASIEFKSFLIRNTPDSKSLVSAMNFAASLKL